MAMSKNEMKNLTDRKEKQEAEGCSESVASLYDGKPCRGTSFHARVPNSCFCDSFFFDHEYMFKCNTAQTQSAKALNACPGSAYFKYQQKFFEDRYRVYDGGVKGIQNACESDGKKCYFHAYVQNSKVLNPVPDYSDNDSGEFHYVSTERIATGDFCEKFTLKKANVLSNARKSNDLCSRVQLNKLLECSGKPELSRESVVCVDGSVNVNQSTVITLWIKYWVGCSL